MPKKKYKDFVKAEAVKDNPVSPIKMGEGSSASSAEPKDTTVTLTTQVKSIDKPNIARASFITNQLTSDEAKKLSKSMDDKVQKEYCMHGLDICVEWPAGLPRMYGKDNSKAGKISTADYGYFKGTKSDDGGGIDVYVGPNHESQNVYLLLQKPTSWDVEHGMLESEQKYMLGFGDITEAENVYKQSMPEEYFLSIGEVDFKDFIQTLTTAKTGKSPIISKSNNASADWRTGYRAMQADLTKYLEGEQSASANQQTTHTAELSEEQKAVTISPVKNQKRLELAEKLKAIGNEPRPTSEGIMSRQSERKYNRTPLVRDTRVKDDGKGSAVPLFTNKLETRVQRRRRVLKSMLSRPISQLGEEIKIIFKL